MILDQWLEAPIDKFSVHAYQGNANFRNLIATSWMVSAYLETETNTKIHCLASAQNPA